MCVQIYLIKAKRSSRDLFILQFMKKKNASNGFGVIYMVIGEISYM